MKNKRIKRKAIDRKRYFETRQPAKPRKRSRRNQPEHKAVSSLAEQELFKYVKDTFPDLKVVANDREVLRGYEIDIWLPTLRLGIEYNGWYWHNQPRMKRNDIIKRNIAKEKHIIICTVWDYMEMDEIKEKVKHKISERRDATGY